VLRVLEMHVMDKMLLFRAHGNLILSDACFGMVMWNGSYWYSTFGIPLKCLAYVRY